MRRRPLRDEEFVTRNIPRQLLIAGYTDVLNLAYTMAVATRYQGQPHIDLKTGLQETYDWFLP